MNATMRLARPLAAVISSLLLALATTAFAGVPTRIIAVDELTSPNAVELHIRGNGFVQPNGAQLHVSLAGIDTPLTIASYGDTEIVVLLPLNIPPGSYSISLVRANNTVTGDVVDEFFFTLGEQGPQGDKGDKGDKGDPGAKGDKGDTGAKGDKGDTGAKGDKGDTGAKGDKGDTGDTGPAGPQGPAGTFDPTQVIGNQTTQQSPANFNISGSGVIGGALNVHGSTRLENVDVAYINVRGSADFVDLGGQLRPDYDSSWFFVKSDGSAPLRNNKGEIVLHTFFTPMRLVIQQCGSVALQQCLTRTVIAGTTGYHDGPMSINPISVTSDGSFTYISTMAGLWAWGYFSSGVWQCEGLNCFEAWYRVIAWR